MSGDNGFGSFCANQNIIIEANLAFVLFRGASAPLPLPGWLRGTTVVERWSLTGELSLSCARHAADV